MSRSAASSSTTSRHSGQSQDLHRPRRSWLSEMRTAARSARLSGTCVSRMRLPQDLHGLSCEARRPAGSGSSEMRTAARFARACANSALSDMRTSRTRVGRRPDRCRCCARSRVRRAAQFQRIDSAARSKSTACCGVISPQQSSSPTATACGPSTYTRMRSRPSSDRCVTSRASYVACGSGR